MRSAIAYYMNRFKPYFLIFLCIQTLTRLFLFAIAPGGASIFDVIQIFARGLMFDITVFAFFAIPLGLYLTLLRRHWHLQTTDRTLMQIGTMLFAGLILFSTVGEYLFWDEFTTRYNFIAVDYLVYTQEVLGNIWESYPVGWLLTALVILSLAVTYFITRSGKLLPRRADVPGFGSRILALVVLLAVTIGLYQATNFGQTQWSAIAVNNELSANGIYNLFYAYDNNEIDYAHFYRTMDSQQAQTRLRGLLQAEGAKFLDKDPGDLTRAVTYPGKEIHKNVILVTIESLSGEYMGAFGNTNNFTPNLDRIAKQGLFFTNLYATGTRTVRGLEAITLSVPPTPGQSILRRTGNEQLFSVGYIFDDRGYDTKFIYGGYGYFDNMNYFFAHNGFEILDRAEFPKNEIEFGNVWGVCDEDLFKQVIKSADASFAAGRPFAHLVMTTSNHRPYTYPAGRIDIPSPGGRAGGVKYTDYAIGEFLKMAEQKPWFKNTVFVFVADHTAGAAGKTELSLNKYHIPLIFYAPGFIKPQIYDKVASQIDLAPTLLGLLRFDYYSKFYGRDVLMNATAEPRAFLSTYQNVALLKKDQLIKLMPQRKIQAYIKDDLVKESAADADIVQDAIAYYQDAAGWRDSMRKLPSTILSEQTSAKTH